MTEAVKIPGGSIDGVEYYMLDANVRLTPGDTLFVDGKRHRVGVVGGGRFTLYPDTRNHQQRRVDRAKARAKATAPNAGERG